MLIAHRWCHNSDVTWLAVCLTATTSQLASLLGFVHAAMLEWESKAEKVPLYLYA